MARPKDTNIHIESKVARLITEMCNNTDKTQLQIAEESGLQGTNIITMFKTGRTKFPIRRIKPFADAVGGDAEELLEVLLSEYMPEVLEVLTTLKGRVLSKDERVLVTALRDAKRDQDQVKDERSKWSTEDTAKVKKWAEDTVKRFTL